MGIMSPFNPDLYKFKVTKYTIIIPGVKTALEGTGTKIRSNYINIIRSSGAKNLVSPNTLV